MKIGARKGTLLICFFDLCIAVVGIVSGAYWGSFAILNIELYERGMAYWGIFSSFILLIGCLWGGCRLFCMICMESSTITLDETGVTNKTRFYEESLRWEDVIEYGVMAL